MFNVASDKDICGKLREALSKAGLEVVKRSGVTN